ncbi:type II toxin-antitoxin system RelE/ParE family toxin [Zavarzinia compransoris]|uniref:type II toxin-antitoxin system RelE/ParE family toxin n=1 Tax=Zavarzinia marina TaxID=2911065 RepID=UPI001F3278A2|nr:type II toxin-antitoxin system RelE/ParE family toxin [Zavarzinia marina]MCF4166394.1 type II toxin-antitoxin system RelE/ParE family toxin [Zavarzinia marina]
MAGLEYAGLEYTEAALADLAAIWTYTSNTWGEEQAEHYIEALEAECLGLATGEIRHRPFPALRALTGYRRCRHHYIFFVRDGVRTIIVAVLHERMDLIARLESRL